MVGSQYYCLAVQPSIMGDHMQWGCFVWHIFSQKGEKTALQLVLRSVRNFQVPGRKLLYEVSRYIFCHGFRVIFVWIAENPESKFLNPKPQLYFQIINPNLNIQILNHEPYLMKCNTNPNHNPLTLNLPLISKPYPNPNIYILNHKLYPLTSSGLITHIWDIWTTCSCECS